MSANAIHGAARRASVARWALGGTALLFGFATLAEGGNVLFGGAAAREAAGHVVPFVLWFNFLAGFAYVLGGAGVLAGRRWALWIARALAAATAAILVAFGVHGLAGGAFEVRTAIALPMRAAFWLVQSLLLSRFFFGDRHA